MEASTPIAHEEGEEHHGSPWPIAVAAGIGLTFLGLALRNVLLFAGFAVFFAAVAGWIYDDYRGRRVPHVPALEGKEGTLQALSPRKVGMWVFLASEVMFFSGIIGGSLGIRASAGEWVAPGEVLNVPVTAINTFILIASSLTMAEALHAIRLGDQPALVRRLLLTLLLGLTFISIQGYEYVQLFAEGLSPTSSPVGPAIYGSTFYIQTGFHGAHVTVGLIGLAYVARKAAKGGFTKENHETVELMGLYWHFVDVVWIFLFTIVYLI